MVDVQFLRDEILKQIREIGQGFLIKIRINSHAVVMRNKIGGRKWTFFRIFFENWISYMGVKMIERIITKNDAADPQKGVFKKSIWKPFDFPWPQRQRGS